MTPETACDLSAQAICFAADQVNISFQQAIWEYERPVVVFKPRLSLDGDQYCFLLGDDLMNGVAGFGDTVAKAAQDFDANFFHQKAKP